MDEPASRHDPYAALRDPEYSAFLVSRAFGGLGGSMLGPVIGWELYQRTHRPMTLAWVGLVQALPIFLFALHAGHVADTRSRKRVAVAGQCVTTAAALALMALSMAHAPVPLYFLCLFVLTTAGAFSNPARQALVRQIVPTERMPNAISWNTTVFRVAAVVGAALGGWIVAVTHQPAAVYAITSALAVVSVLLMGRVTNRPPPPGTRERATWNTLLAGIRYISETRIILATITLDLVAVLLGGATTLLPVYAKDILHVGAAGFGLLESAPSAGALVTALALTHFPPFKYPGRAMLWAVGGFGLATIAFGLSRSMPLSLFMLFLTGALDMISVVVRSSLVQTLTPQEMQGRVSAVNSVFITTSNEVGGFESGVVAQYTSPLFSVVSGGIGTLLTVVLTAYKWPTVRRYVAGSMEEEPRERAAAGYPEEQETKAEK